MRTKFLDTEFLAYCEANGGAPDLTAYARDVMLSRRAAGVTS